MNIIIMGKKVGKRSIASMKYHLYQKVLNRNTFPAFSVMFNAGVSSVLPTPLENISVPKGINTNYGIVYATIISALLSALNNLAISTFNSNANSFSFLQLGQSPIYGQTSGLAFINSFTKLYDNYVNLCSILYQPAVFDETYFDLSVFQPSNTIINRNQACEKIEQYFNSLSYSNISINLSTLGIGNTQIPNVDNYSLNNIQDTGISDLLNALNLNYNQLPDLAKFIVSFIPNLNNIINSGFALDVGWLDRCVLAPEIEEYPTYKVQLQNNMILQNFADVFGMILDYTPLDLAILIPEFNPNNVTQLDLVTILTADKTIISIFGSLFKLHLYDSSPGGINITYSSEIENYAVSYEQFLQVQRIVNQKYPNIWYAKMIASAILEIARYPYQQNYSYNSGKRTLSYNDFLNYWRTKWSFYGISNTDLQFAQQLGEQLQGQAKIENSIKLAQKSIKAKQYKSIFYYKNFKNIAER
ncbi:hypothetical protein CCL45_gp33 [Sulfolobus islandicus rod-shaped virus 5]|uniref:Uncharacterized protein n=2 Tax=Usarudivirus SIRV5 TaxID=2846591 RepID=A0A1X9SKJ4_9VIRU|nr:hypothetical protein CCL45_gp33 [Sulfolobus islandicus rod-shaped virus 5]YP_009362894.1 hypothetical protein CCL44_gp32 [Sulfolobus islandicus rod-shaped phage 6]ARQ96655.1 hypothetical protein [Sulfolobus islandicus rod-shaped virus 5]ARQ96761.1 hypothetical protein [Sulfolobus islandicus rod-shaped phage 6]